MTRREVERPILNEAHIPYALRWVEEMARRGLEAGPVVVRMGRPRRTLEQNSHFHPLVREIKRHMEDNGAAKRSERWWRYVLLAKFGGVVTDADPFAPGGVIVINRHVGTSDLSKPDAAEFIDWLYSFGVDIGVEWSQAHRDIVKEHGRGE
jgi:hypothetical protein